MKVAAKYAQSDSAGPWYVIESEILGSGRIEEHVNAIPWEDALPRPRIEMTCSLSLGYRLACLNYTRKS